MTNSSYKTKNPLAGKLPYRFGVSKLLPTDGWEHLEQPIMVLRLHSLYMELGKNQEKFARIPSALAVVNAQK